MVKIANIFSFKKNNERVTNQVILVALESIGGKENAPLWNHADESTLALQYIKYEKEASEKSGISVEDLRDRILKKINFKPVEDDCSLCIYLEEEVLQTLFLLEKTLVTFSYSLIKQGFEKELAVIIKKNVKDTVIKELTISEQEVNTTEIRENYLKLSPEWWRLVEEIEKNLFRDMLNLYVSKFGGRSARNFTDEHIKDLESKYSTLAGYDEFIRSFPIGFLRSDQIGLLTKDELMKEIGQQTKDLREANENLREVSQLKSEFVSLAAHQIRTPLTGIKWAIDMLLDEKNGTLTSTQRTIGDQAKKGVNNLIVLINQLLDVARIEENREEFIFKPYDLRTLLKRRVENYLVLAHEKGIAMKYDFSDPSPLMCLCDPDRIAIVIDNILENSIRYTKPQKNIEIEAFTENNSIKISVSDEGIGIPKEQIVKVGGKFYRATNAAGYNSSGTGLGLHMSIKIIERHHGKILMESIENVGTTFTIVLPEIVKESSI